MFASAAGSGAVLQGDDRLRNDVPGYPGLELAADPIRVDRRQGDELRRFGVAVAQWQRLNPAGEPMPPENHRWQGMLTAMPNRFAPTIVNAE